MEYTSPRIGFELIAYVVPDTSFDCIGINNPITNSKIDMYFVLSNILNRYEIFLKPIAMHISRN